MNELTPQAEKTIDLMGEYLFERFMVFVDQEDTETSKSIMDEWIVDGQDPEVDDVEFMTLNKIEE